MAVVIEPETYRDSIPTVDQAGKRVWIYPRKPPTGKRASGRAVNFYRLRELLSIFLLLFLVIGPFLRINGNPVLMMNIVERKFSVLGIMFWPQDLYIFAVMMVTGFVMIVLFTAVFGRIWCGWLCPQTVLMEMVFRKIEYWIEGDALEQKRLADAPPSAEKTRKRILKHGIFLVLSFGISNLLLAYVIGSDAWITLVTDPPAQHLKGLTAMLVFTFVFYKIFARFREQACTFICPYGRVQSVLLDENSIVVAYDHVRGENRGPKKRSQNMLERRSTGLGDCVDCNMCVSVCPTGIDIRNGTQMECVNCTACIDACNSVMDRLHLPPGLIRYASENNIKEGRKLEFTPRLMGYTVVLTGLLTLLTILLVNRTPVEADILRVAGTWFQEQADGQITNMFQARVVNKSNEPALGTFQLLDQEGSILFANQRLEIPAQEEASTILVVSLASNEISGAKTKIRIAFHANDEQTQIVDTIFLAPVHKGATP